MPMDREQVLTALAEIEDPDLGRDIVSLDLVKDVTVRNGNVALALELQSPSFPGRGGIEARCREVLSGLPDVEQVDIAATLRVTTSPRTDDLEMIPGVKNTIAVASGKGGVGKSAVALNMAVLLARMGAKVGLLDADIYGPSIPKMAGAEGLRELLDSGAGKPAPPEAHGVKIVSIGFFVQDDEPVIWRGPMAHQALRQFLGDFDWGELDYLILDLPPGTGDVQLTLVQSIPLTGAAIICTPQDVALLDATKGLRMFQKVNANILGIVENMSWHICPHCGERTEIFSHGGAREASEKLGVPFLGAIPLDLGVRVSCDSGEPYMLGGNDETEVGRAYTEVASELVAEVKKHNDRANQTRTTISIKR